MPRPMVAAAAVISGRSWPAPNRRTGGLPPRRSRCLRWQPCISNSRAPDLAPKKDGKREETVVTDHQKTAPLARDAMAYVLAGGRGSRLMELTDRRAKPAVYFGGKSRIIDFALSNALNSGIRRISVATQYKAHSLIRHLQMGWNFFRPE